MKTMLLSSSVRHITLASALILMAGCAAPKKTPTPAPAHPAPTSHCPAKYPQHYADATQRYSICLPANVSKGDASGLPAGTVVFTGFSVPTGTNLVSKRLIIQPGADDTYILQNPTTLGSFTADGVTFQRVESTDVGAGQQYLNIIYVWKHNGKQLNFVFSHHAVNPGIIGPPQPTVYNQAAQLKITEEIMRTFHRLH
jgi:hypothetical protein